MVDPGYTSGVVLLFSSMAYRLLREVRQALTRHDKPPSQSPHHPFSAIARMRRAWPLLKAISKVVQIFRALQPGILRCQKPES